VTHPTLVEPLMHAFDLALAADDHRGGVLGDKATPPRESTHARTPRNAAQTPLQVPVSPVIRSHSPGLHFDVTRESLRLDEFLHSTRRFPA
jgi:hypothetical protein